MRVQILEREPLQIISPIFYNGPIVTKLEQPIINEPKWYPQKNIQMPRYYFEEPIHPTPNIRSYAQVNNQLTVSYPYRFGY